MARTRNAQAWAMQIAGLIQHNIKEGKELPFDLPGTQTVVPHGQAIRITQEIMLAKKQMDGMERSRATERALAQVEASKKGKHDIPDYVVSILNWKVTYRLLDPAPNGKAGQEKPFGYVPRAQLFVTWQTGRARKASGLLESLADNLMREMGGGDEKLLSIKPGQVYENWQGESAAPEATPTSEPELDAQDQFLAKYLRGPK